MNSLSPYWECTLFGDFMQICQQEAQFFTIHAVDSQGQRMADGCNLHVGCSLDRICAVLPFDGVRGIRMYKQRIFIAAVLPEACIVVQPKSKSGRPSRAFLAACAYDISLLLFSTWCLQLKSWLTLRYVACRKPA